MTLRSLAGACLLLLGLMQPARACSIPVFRYALERWQADLFEVSVFFEEKLSDADMQRLNQLEDWAAQNGGNVNIEVVRCDLKEKVPADLLTVWKSLNAALTPHVVVRSPREHSGQRVVWHGPLADAFLDDLSMSPARREVVQRLLKGDAVVWLMLRGTDNEAAEQAKLKLDETLKKIEAETLLPPGVGKPGSELQSKIPLRVKFSVVDVPADAKGEQALFSLLRGRFKTSPSASETIVAPIFGRGRVLEVFQSKEVDEESISDLTQYLCGACSCQVKQQNPGFDLPFALNWEEKLFDDGQVPLSDAPTSAESGEAELVAIPGGSARDSQSKESTQSTSASASSVSGESSSNSRYRLTLTIAGLVVLLVAVGLLR